MSESEKIPTGCPTSPNPPSSTSGTPSSGNSPSQELDAGQDKGVSRRTMLLGGVASAAAVAGLAHAAKQRRSKVFLARNQRYDGDLHKTIRDGLLASGVTPQRINGRRVLLKPNMVEPVRSVPHMTTHPAVVAAAIEVFRNWGASVIVGEAPGHVRDTDMALLESGIQSALDDTKTPFADLNYEDSVWTPNRGGASPLKGFYFPKSIATADFVVSMPKFKAHHWVGLTAGMKNLYGTLPGIKYGWPKNVLHHAGIPQTVYDINASLPTTLTIVDGIVCMEGDGPIMGTPKSMGIIAIGENLCSVDATLARVMGLDPREIPYLKIAAERLGPICPKKIVQTGEDWRPLVSPFKMIDYPHIRAMQDANLGPQVT